MASSNGVLVVCTPPTEWGGQMREMVVMPQLLTIVVESSSVTCHIVVIRDASERGVLYIV